MSAYGPTGDRQEHLDANSPSQELAREAPVSESQHPHDQVGHGRPAGGVPLPVLKKEKDPTSKQFDDGECSLAAAQNVTTDIPEDTRHV